MTGLGPLLLTTPAVLLGALALPLLWWLIRRLPPPLRRLPFPAIRLLGAVETPPPPMARPPWWLLVLRLGALTALLLALAGPVWAPPAATPPPQRLLLVLDNDWTSAGRWADVRAAAARRLASLDPQTARVALVTTTPPPGGWGGGAIPAPRWVSVETARQVLAAVPAYPWRGDRAGVAAVLARLSPRADAALWLSTGWAAADDAALGRALAAHGPARLVIVEETPVAVRQFDGVAGGWQVQLVRPAGLPARTERLLAIDAAGRVRADVPVVFGPREITATARVQVPVAELGRITRLVVEGQPSAAAVALLDAGVLRPRVVLLSGERAGATSPLRSAAFYVRRALEPHADVQSAPAAEAATVAANLKLLVDLPIADAAQARAMLAWVRQGGVAVTIAGPRVAENGTRLAPAPLVTGIRTVGTRLSWDAPQPLGGFAADGPLAGLVADPAVVVRRQVLADPSAPGVERWAWLKDGTPLVTARREGAGLLVMLHTDADPAWSNLPLGGLFEPMLRRLLPLAAGVAHRRDVAAEPLVLEAALDGEGVLADPLQPALIPPARWPATAATAITPPGLYRAGGDVRALNLARVAGPVGPAYRFQSRADVTGLPVDPALTGRARTPLAPWLLGLALLLLAADGLWSTARLSPWARLWPGRSLPWRRRAGAGLMMTGVLVLGLLLVPSQTRARSVAVDPDVVALAVVASGNPAADDRARAGLAALAQVLATRTAVRPAPVRVVDPATADLGRYALLYWPAAAPLSPAGARRLSAYLASGGLAVVDFGADVTPAAAARLLGPLALPRLEPLTGEHVLARTFYLLDRFPGRRESDAVWVEAGTAGREGGVAGVVLGGSGWADAWAGDGDARRRELALRFGINLVMYALTGTYKADQAHVKALLDRLPERQR